MDINYLSYQIPSDDEIVPRLFEVDIVGEENKTDYLTNGENEPPHSEAFGALDLAFKGLRGKKNQTQLNHCS
jgi:hypothetical protein